MILLLAVIAGLLAGLLRARFRKQPLNSPELNEGWLVFLAVIPQIIIFRNSSLASRMPLGVVITVLLTSQVVLIWFAWRNRHQQGFLILGLGLFLNCLVMILNGGLMPIRPEAVRMVYAYTPTDAWQVGSRLGHGKDIVLTLEQTRLWWLSDYFVLAGNPWLRLAFSIGDVFIAIGTFAYLWSLGGPTVTPKKGIEVS